MGVLATGSKLFTFAAALCLVATCAGDGGAGPGAQGDPPDVESGQELVQTAGCVSCHGAEGQGGAGPPWVDLAGSTVELEGGRTVTADADYLFESIADPSAERVAGFNVKMPDNKLSERQVLDIVAYISTLSGSGA
jgi:cytochrome c oxidase subunit 2